MTKIGFLRNEFERIGCKAPKNPLEPRLYVGWDYTEILVSGFHSKRFDYDLLCAVLKQIPDGAGEEYFWGEVFETDFNKLADDYNRRQLIRLAH